MAKGKTERLDLCRTTATERIDMAAQHIVSGCRKLESLADYVEIGEDDACRFG